MVLRSGVAPWWGFVDEKESTKTSFTAISWKLLQTAAPRSLVG